MTKPNDDFEQMIRENLYRDAEAIEKEVEMSGTEDISDERKEAIRRKVKNRIDAYERERAYAGLSEEDREALKIGRKVREEQKAGKKKSLIKEWKKYAGIAAAVALCVCMYGVKSMGHGEKFASQIEQIVGGRKVVKINSGEGNKIRENDEEAAYQKIKEAFGVDIVKLVRVKGMKFVGVDIDENLQVAELLYQYEGENLWYVIGVGYYDFSFGFDAEDEIIKKKEIETKKTTTELTVYRRKGSGEIKCSAHFAYQKLEYFLAGNISDEDFEKF